MALLIRYHNDEHVDDITYHTDGHEQRQHYCRHDNYHHYH